MSYILEASDRAARETARAGGKGASLARLRDLGVPVPAFFVIDARAFAAMDGAEFEAAFRSDLEHACAALDAPAFAVRSSAIAEDSAAASHAGLYETVLDVRGFGAVLDAVRRCWASFHAGFADGYRAERRIDGEDGMAVVVQRYVPAVWAGVCFTADPVRRSLSRMVVNASPGPGEALVSGHVTPEEIVLDGASGATSSRTAGDHDGAVPADIVAEVHALSKRIADAWGFPQDVEWAVADGAVQVLQSRPITTLTALHYNRHIEPWKDTPEDAENPDKMWSRVYADEIWSSPISPLFYNVQNLSPSFVAWRRWHHDARPLSPVVFKYHQAAAYVDVDILHQKYEYHPRFARIEGVLGFFPPDMRDAVRRAPFRWWGRLRRHASMELKRRRERSLAHNHRHLEQVWPPLIERSNAWFDMDLESLGVGELRAHQEEVRREQIRVSDPCQYAVVYHAHDLTFVLTGLLGRWFGDGAALYAQVSSGLVGSEAVREANQVWRLAALIRDCGNDAVERVRAGRWHDLMNSSRPELLTVQREMTAFWRSHRHRGASYKDLVYPRWGDEPDLLLELVKGYLASDAGAPLERNAAQADEREAVQRELLGRLRGPFAPARRALLRTLFRHNEIYMGLRDDHRFYFDRVWYALRRIYLGYGRHLAERGVVDAADDVFFLGADEVEAGLEGGLRRDAARPRIDVRRREWHETLHRQPPKFLRGYMPVDDGSAAPAAGSLRGIGASPGVVRGRARIVHSLGELSSLGDSEILVTRQTDPGWTAVFPRIGGLVLETGGALAHGASLCREYGLPCVTAVDRAMERIPDGALISIDGARGTVSLTTP